jgi:hypothetical protein
MSLPLVWRKRRAIIRQGLAGTIRSMVRRDSIGDRVWSWMGYTMLVAFLAVGLLH